MKYHRLGDISLKPTTRVLRDRLEDLGFNLARSYGTHRCWIVCNKDWKPITQYSDLVGVEEFIRSAHIPHKPAPQRPHPKQDAYGRLPRSPRREAL